MTLLCDIVKVVQLFIQTQAVSILRCVLPSHAHIEATRKHNFDHFFVKRKELPVANEWCGFCITVVLKRIDTNKNVWPQYQETLVLFF